jgi:hypothetical protein
MPIELYDVVEILDTPATREAETAGAVGPIIGESIPTQPGERRPGRSGSRSWDRP